MCDLAALLPLENNLRTILNNALSLWADSTTHASSLRRDELIHDKKSAVSGFFTHVNKHPGEVNPLDVNPNHELESG